MYNLIRFIQKHHFVILFLVLEVLCILFMTWTQGFHRQKRVNVTNDVVGRVYETGRDIGDYFRLRKINEQLAEENALLRRMVTVTTDTAQRLYDYLNADTVYEFIPARVVNSTVNRPNNYILINKGERDGIVKDMGVVSPEGIVGIVAEVSPHYASVMSLLHSYSTISVRFKNNGQLANLRWETSNYRYGIIDDIPTHLTLNEGDTIAINATKTEKAYITGIKDTKVINPLKPWLTFDREKLEGTIVSLPTRADIDEQIEEHKIVELYSK